MKSYLEQAQEKIEEIAARAAEISSASHDEDKGLDYAYKSGALKGLIDASLPELRYLLRMSGKERP